MTTITSIEALRRIVPEPRRTTRAKILDRLDDQARAFIARVPFAVLGTSGENGLEVSPKGDKPGFVLIEDDRTVALPERAGNNLAFGLSNIIGNPEVGLLLVTPGTGETLRISGRAEITADADLLDRLTDDDRPALLAIRVHIRHCFFHCARAFLRAGLWQPESWPEPQKVSFGKIIATQLQAEDDVAQQIDDFVADGYAGDLYRN